MEILLVNSAYIHASFVHLIFDKHFICMNVDNASVIRITDLKNSTASLSILLHETHNRHESHTLFLIVQFRHISSMISHPLWRGRRETRQCMKTTYVRIRRSRTIYAVLTVDAPAMHFYPAPRQLSRREVGSIDIISGLCTTRAEFTMRFRMHAATYLP